MLDAVVEKKMQLWNWGGTWLSQNGVYQFKSRWGTKDYPYFYHVRVVDPAGMLEEVREDELLASYPYFYTIPFS